MEENKKMEKKVREKPSRQAVLKTLIIVLSVVLALAVVVLGILLNSAGKEEKLPAASQEGQSQTPAEPETMTLETSHGAVRIDAALAEVLRYEEQKSGGRITEIYTLVLGGTEKEVFRICFGDETQGDLIGYLGDRAVTVLVTPYGEADFQSAQEQQTYERVMDLLNLILESVYGSSDFVSDLTPEAEPVQTQQAVLTYWTVELPMGMRWEESTADGQYKAEFYGAVSGEEYLLYTVTLGGEVADPLGAYLVDGTAMVLGITVNNASSQMAYTEDGSMEAYGTMMDTVNGVLQVIEASENYIE